MLKSQFPHLKFCIPVFSEAAKGPLMKEEMCSDEELYSHLVVAFDKKIRPRIRFQLPGDPWASVLDQ